MMPATPSRDTIGPLARTVKDAALVLDAIAGYDPNDPVTAATTAQDAGVLHVVSRRLDGLRGMRFGVIRQPIGGDTDTSAPDYREVRTMMDGVVAALRG